MGASLSCKRQGHLDVGHAPPVDQKPAAKSDLKVGEDMGAGGGALRSISEQRVPKRFALRSVHNTYLSAQPNGRAEWNRRIAQAWETFVFEHKGPGVVSLKSAHGKYVSAQPDGSIQINRTAAPRGGWEDFRVEVWRIAEAPLRTCIALKSVPFGTYVSAQHDGRVLCDRKHAPAGGWERFLLVDRDKGTNVDVEGIHTWIENGKAEERGGAKVVTGRSKTKSQDQHTKGVLAVALPEHEHEANSPSVDVMLAKLGADGQWATRAFPTPGEANQAQAAPGRQRDDGCAFPEAERTCCLTPAWMAHTKMLRFIAVFCRLFDHWPDLRHRCEAAATGSEMRSMIAVCMRRGYGGQDRPRCLMTGADVAAVIEKLIAGRPSPDQKRYLALAVWLIGRLSSADAIVAVMGRACDRAQRCASAQKQAYVVLVSHAGIELEARALSLKRAPRTHVVASAGIKADPDAKAATEHGAEPNDDDLCTCVGAKRRVLACIEDYLDDHKEQAFMSGLHEPARFYYHCVGDEGSKNHVDVHGLNWYLCALRGGLGAQLPIMPHDTDRDKMSVCDVWSGLSNEAWEAFADPRHFGLKMEGVKPLQRGVRDGARRSFVARRVGSSPFDGSPCDTEACARRGDKRLATTMQRFAHFFRRDFLVRRMFENLNAESKPEHMGFRRAVDTLFTAFRDAMKIDGVSVRADTLVEFVYADEYFTEFDSTACALFFAWLGVVKRPSCGELRSWEAATVVRYADVDDNALNGDDGVNDVELVAAAAQSAQVGGAHARSRSRSAMQPVEAERVECAVCLEPLGLPGADECFLPCAHRFHTACVARWFQGHSTCPTCKAPVDMPAGERSAAPGFLEVQRELVKNDTRAALRLETALRGELSRAAVVTGHDIPFEDHTHAAGVGDLEAEANAYAHADRFVDELVATSQRGPQERAGVFETWQVFEMTSSPPAVLAGAWRVLSNSAFERNVLGAGESDFVRDAAGILFRLHALLLTDSLFGRAQQREIRLLDRLHRTIDILLGQLEGERPRDIDGHHLGALYMQVAASWLCHLQHQDKLPQSVPADASARAVALVRRAAHAITNCFQRNGARAEHRRHCAGLLDRATMNVVHETAWDAPEADIMWATFIA